MNLTSRSRSRNEVSDEEIERDVLELRRLLEGLPDPAEPHPAYWQNFVVRVRSRIDERGSRRRWAPSMAWTTVTAAAVVVVLAVAGVLPTINSPTPDSVVRRTALSRSSAADAAAAADPLAFERNGSSSLVLSTEDVSMLKAIMADDEAAMLMAMVESPG